MCAVAVAVLALVSVSVVEGVALDAPSFMSSSSSDNDGPPCSPPDPIENGLASWDGRSKGARYACFQGYHLVGPPRIECRYGTWYSDDTAEVLPNCKPIVCNHPVIANGALETGESVRYRMGEEAAVECDEGFELKMRASGGRVICTEDGSWKSAENQNEFPVCREKSCPYPDPSLPEIENGSLEINGNRNGVNSGYKPGSVAIYMCHSAGAGAQSAHLVLVPLSAGKRVCHRGRWEGNGPPACVAQHSKPNLPARAHCPAPMSISNGYYFTDRSSEAPLALPKRTQEKYERGTIARYHCKDGYSLNAFHGQEIYRCMTNGEWSPRVPPVCISLETNLAGHDDPLEQVMCPSPTAIPYADFERVEGWLTSNGAIHGTVLEYGCRVGYRDSRTPCLPARRTCHAGKWVGRVPSCVPFDYCERPPIISHGYMSPNAPVENAYHVMSEVRYECHAGFVMKGGADSLKCHATGCWMPNELPTCVREDLYEPGWSSNEEANVPLIAVLVSVSAGCALVAILASACLVVVCRRKGGPGSAPPAGPAHWSTTVTVTPECRQRGGVTAAAAVGRNQEQTVAAAAMCRQDQDRMALIAFADGVQQVTLPSYEEALRDSASSRQAQAAATNQGAASSATTSSAAMCAQQQAQPPPHLSLPEFRHYRQQQQHYATYGHGHGNGRAASGNSSRSRSRGQQQHQHQGGGVRYDVSDTAAVNVQFANPSGRIRRGHHFRAASNGSGGGGGGGGNSGGEHDALSDSLSHQSVQSASLWTAAPANGGHGGRRPGAYSSQSSQSTSLRSSSTGSASVETVGPDTIQETATTPPGSNGAPNAAAVIYAVRSGGNQNPSSRALAGSLGSFDTSPADGVPLLEENELLETTEGSNSSVSGGDTGSATYSETSSKT